jgi:hypothetical protein
MVLKYVSYYSYVFSLLEIVLADDFFVVLSNEILL